jgi:galactonate dehydratase
MEVTDYELFQVAPRWQFLKLETDTDHVGWGEPILESRADAVASTVRNLLDEYVVGRDAAPIERRWQEMYRGEFYRGGGVHMSAIAGIDQALWDLKGKHLGVPVHELLGGRARDRVQAYAHVHGDTPEAAAEQAASLVDQGFTTLKCSTHMEWEWLDTPAAVAALRERLETIREAVGDDVDLGVDFHGRPSKSMAKRLVVALEGADPAFYEEPVAPEKHNALESIADRTSVPIATGERLFERAAFRPLLEAEAVDVVQPDLSHAGGITEVRKIATASATYDAALAPHCPLGPVALAASLQIDACSQNAVLQEQVLNYDEIAGEPVPAYTTDPDVLAVDDEGFLSVPTGAGLGVELDEDRLRAHECDVDWSPPTVHRADGSIAEW